MTRKLLIALLLLLSSCSADEIDFTPERGVYYWKTVFYYGQFEEDYVKTRNISRMYIRMFDVDYAVDYDGEYKSIPIATTRFDYGTPRDVEIVPVVYITYSSIRHDPDFGQRLYKRIKAMAKYNCFEFKEIQLDCDWTAGTRANYFSLCKDVRDLCHSEGKKLSSTIRLHQLKQSAPPVDKGVLMLYNTGNLKSVDTRNSILDHDDAKPYLKNTIEYEIPLSFACPSYGWGVLFRNGEFMAILHKNDFGDKNLYEETGGSWYRVTSGHVLEGHDLHPGDSIRLERSDYREIDKTVELAVKCLGQPKEFITYHLDSSY